MTKKKVKRGFIFFLKETGLSNEFSIEFETARIVKSSDRERDLSYSSFDRTLPYFYQFCELRRLNEILSDIYSVFTTPTTIMNDKKKRKSENGNYSI